MSTRIERDPLGEVAVPVDVYWGAQTARALANFPVSGIKADPTLVIAYAHIKRACAVANRDLGRLDADKAAAIIQAAEEVADGALADQFVVDVFQSGAGTSFHMNVNEVLANRALEILGYALGAYEELSPNDHVNLGQSSNDTYPTATHVAIMMKTPALLAALDRLSEAFAAKADECWDVMKAGRTHLEDAVPVRLGQELRAYASVLGRSRADIAWCAAELGRLPLGGTATGSGLLGGARFRAAAVAEMASATGLELSVAADPFEAIQSRFPLARYSGALRSLALELVRIANDIRLMGSGPTAGLRELEVPAVQPGSSIMPGKANPVMAECLDMICFHVVGADTTVALATQAGQLELNVMTPVIAYELLFSIGILSAFLPQFASLTVDGLEPNRERCAAYAASTPALATALNPRIGYMKAAEVVKAAAAQGKTIREVVLERGILSEAEVDRLLAPEELCDVLEDRESSRDPEGPE